MKKILLFIILLCSGYVNAQTKRDNAIIVAHLHFRQALSTALDAGYNIAVKDDSLQYFSTTARNDKHHNLVVFHVRIKDSIAIITGELNLNMTLYFGSVSSNTTNHQIEFRGMADSPLKQSWYSMDDFAKLFGLPVSYGKF